jgi:hypothetical protein
MIRIPAPTRRTRKRPWAEVKLAVAVQALTRAWREGPDVVCKASPGTPGKSCECREEVTIEHLPETSADSICAWCGSVLGVKSRPCVGEEGAISHGVCEACAREVERQAERLYPAGDDCGCRSRHPGLVEGRSKN